MSKYRKREEAGQLSMFGGGGPQQLGLFSQVVQQAKKKRAVQRAPKGYRPAPGSKKGGWTDGRGHYWYPNHPGRGNTHPEARDLEHARASKVSGAQLAMDQLGGSEIRQTAAHKEREHRERHAASKRARTVPQEPTVEERKTPTGAPQPQTVEGLLDRWSLVQQGRADYPTGTDRHTDISDEITAWTKTASAEDKTRLKEALVAEEEPSDRDWPTHRFAGWLRLIAHAEKYLVSAPAPAPITAADMGWETWHAGHPTHRAARDYHRAEFERTGDEAHREAARSHENARRFRGYHKSKAWAMSREIFGEPVAEAPEAERQLTAAELQQRKDAAQKPRTRVFVDSDGVERSINPTDAQIEAMAKQAHERLNRQVERWVILSEGTAKEALLDEYDALSTRQQAALAFQVQDLTEEKHPDGYITAYRHLNHGDDPSKMGGASVSTSPDWKHKHNVHAFRVHHSDILLSYEQAAHGSRLGSGGHAFSYAHEQEIILKRDAEPEHVGPVAEPAHPAASAALRALEQANPEAVALLDEAAQEMERRKGAGVARTPAEHIRRKAAEAREAPEQHEEIGDHTPLSRADTAVATGPRDSIEERVASGKISRDDVLEKPTIEKSKARGDSPGAHHLKSVLHKLVSPKPLGGRSERWRRGRHALGHAANTPHVVALNFSNGARLLTASLDRCKTAAEVLTVIKELQGLREAEFQSEVYPTPKGTGYFDREDAAQKADALAKWKAANPGSTDDVRLIGHRTVYAPETREERKARNASGKLLREPIGIQYIIRDSFQARLHERRFDALGEGFSKLTKGQLTPALRKALRQGEEMDKAGWSDAEAQAAAKKKGARAGLDWSDVRGESFERLGGREVARADGKVFAEDFGLRNVQYGKTMSHEDRGFHLKAGHEALHDLADVLGVEPGVVSMGGKLAVAFGARGKGGKGAGAAHYEPSLQILNLTARAGAGSLAHEWGHFMDHVVGDGSGGEWLTTSGDHAHPEVAAALDAVGAAMFGASSWERRKGLEEAFKKTKAAKLAVDVAEGGHGITSIEARRAKGALKSARRSMKWEKQRHEAAARKGTQFSRDALSFDGPRASSYWSTTEEMFARAFESWVESSLADEGRRNAYLVRGTTHLATTMVAAERHPDAVAAEKEAAREVASKHPESIAAGAAHKAAHETYEAVLEAQVIEQSKGRAKRNKWGMWSDAQRSKAHGSEKVREAQQATRRALKAVSEAREKHTPAVSKHHDGTEGHGQAQPYPHGAEREAINGAMRSLVDALIKHEVLQKAFGLTKGAEGLTLFGTMVADRLGAQ